MRHMMSPQRYINRVRIDFKVLLNSTQSSKTRQGFVNLIRWEEPKMFFSSNECRKLHTNEIQLDENSGDHGKVAGTNKRHISQALLVPRAKARFLYRVFTRFEFRMR